MKNLNESTEKEFKKSLERGVILRKREEFLQELNSDANKICREVFRDQIADECSSEIKKKIEEILIYFRACDTDVLFWSENTTNQILEIIRGKND